MSSCLWWDDWTARGLMLIGAIACLNWSWSLLKQAIAQRKAGL